MNSSPHKAARGLHGAASMSWDSRETQILPGGPKFYDAVKQPLDFGLTSQAVRTRLTFRTTGS